MRSSLVFFTTTACLCLSLAACSDKKSEAANDEPQASFDGTITLDGTTREMKSCSLSGSGVDELATITLDGGDPLIMPLHERDMSYAGAKLECKGSSDTTKKNSRIRAELDIECTGDHQLSFTGTLECG